MRFKPGDAVRARVENPAGHTRLPAYLRGRCGRVERIAGEFAFPGELAAGIRNPRTDTLYSVSFAASEVWGADAPASTRIYADLYESYLEAT